jgi:hypothetical protein
MKPIAVISGNQIQQSIRFIRRHKVLLDTDLAGLYQVATKVLIQAVKRNIDRFPADFMFQLTKEEFAVLRSQTVIPKSRGGRRIAPYAFTEQGVAMLSSVINSTRAVQVNIQIMRTFVQLREMLSTNKDLDRKLTLLEKKFNSQFQVVFHAIRELMTPKPLPKKRIGFKVK